MAPGSEASASAGNAPGRGRDPALMPCILLRKGRVCRPGPDGPIPSRTGGGVDVDIFDVLDALAPQYRSVYLVDLDGIERNDPQLEYIQEVSRDTTLWVDAGVRTADGAIDILVAGAERAVLSSSYLRGPRELKRAWKLSTDLVFEVELSDGIPSPADPAWGAVDALALAASARAAGPDTVILSPRGADPSWELVTSVAAHGPTWVDGTFTRAEIRSLAAANAAGGIFHIEDVLDTLEAA
jgi:Histidine biosynthesis protein